jgi:hypothetical protein
MLKWPLTVRERCTQPDLLSLLESGGINFWIGNCTLHKFCVFFWLELGSLFLWLLAEILSFFPLVIFLFGILKLLGTTKRSKNWTNLEIWKPIHQK